MYRPSLVNRVTTHLYDKDGRIYTYSVESSMDGQVWAPIFVNRRARGRDVFDMKQPQEMKFVRLSGTNTSSAHDHLHLFQFLLDFIPPNKETPSLPSDTPTNPLPSAVDEAPKNTHISEQRWASIDFSAVRGMLLGVAAVLLLAGDIRDASAIFVILVSAIAARYVLRVASAEQPGLFCAPNR